MRKLLCKFQAGSEMATRGGGAVWGGVGENFAVTD